LGEGSAARDDKDSDQEKNDQGSFAYPLHKIPPSWNLSLEFFRIRASFEWILKINVAENEVFANCFLPAHESFPQQPEP